jgi:hypothetical protein
MQLRGIWGSFAEWRISDGVETFREQGASVLLAGSHRSVAPQWPFANALCQKHRLARNVFARWLKYLAGEEAARKHVEYQRELHREERRQQREKRGKKPQRRRYGVSTDVRNKAVQAF